MLSMLQQFLRFCSVGVIATGLQYLILIGLSEAKLLDAVTASAIGYVLSATVNYLLNYYFTFSSGQMHRVAAVRFAAVSTIGLMLNTLLMHIGVSMFGLHYLPTQVGATIVVLVWNFSASRMWTYRPSE